MLKRLVEARVRKTQNFMTKHKPKNKTGAVHTRLGAESYISFTKAAKASGKSSSALARAILDDYARRINAGEISVKTETKIV